MYDLNNAYESFKVHERELIEEAHHKRMAQSLKVSTRKANPNLVQMGRFLVKVGTHLVESYDEAEITLPASSVRIAGNEA